MTRILIPGVIALALVYFLGFGIGLLVAQKRSEACLKQHELINGAAVCADSPVVWKTGYARLNTEIARYILAEKEAGKVEDVSMYFRDLHDGPAFGVNELDDFAPASLLKVPVAMLYLSWQEREPGILDERLTFTGASSSMSQIFVPQQSLVEGQTYSIEELLRTMIVYSDNASYMLLMRHLQASGNTGRLLETYQELGIFGVDESLSDAVSVRRYAGIFRVLYNAAYLSPASSEKLLGWLADVRFDAGLAAGVPREVRIANKFGERETVDALQLHDCGIVYFPRNPYLLCIMTRGADLDAQKRIIGEISRMVYAEMESRRIE